LSLPFEWHQGGSAQPVTSSGTAVRCTKWWKSNAIGEDVVLCADTSIG
jgi:hypothetical protein